MIDLEKKQNQIHISNVYCLHVTTYTPDVQWDEEEPISTGWAILNISAEEYEQLKQAGVKCEEYTQIVFGKTKIDDTGESRPIRQLMFKYVAYVDRADHTNF